MVLAAVLGGGLAAGAGAVGNAAASGGQRPQAARAARFVFVGDTGTGDHRARGVADQIHRAALAAPVSHIFFLGDNVYEDGDADGISSKFLDVYRDVFDLGAKGHAALGNHDVEQCRDSGRKPVPRDASAYLRARNCWVDTHLTTPEFGYRDGSRYYSVEIPGQPRPRQAVPEDQRGPASSRPAPLVEVFVLDSNTLGEDQTKIRNGTDDAQLRWLAEALGRSRARWKVVALHHPVYAPERCRWWLWCREADEALRGDLEPILGQHGVDAVFQAHQHLYARLQPQHGIRYFVTGAGGKEPDSFRPDPRTVPRDDAGKFNHFVLVQATVDQFGYCVVDTGGRTRDSGGFARGDPADAPLDGDWCPPP